MLLRTCQSEARAAVEAGAGGVGWDALAEAGKRQLQLWEMLKKEFARSASD